MWCATVWLVALLMLTQSGTRHSPPLPTRSDPSVADFDIRFRNTSGLNVSENRLLETARFVMRAQYLHARTELNIGCVTMAGLNALALLLQPEAWKPNPAGTIAWAFSYGLSIWAQHWLHSTLVYGVCVCRKVPSPTYFRTHT